MRRCVGIAWDDDARDDGVVVVVGDEDGCWAADDVGVGGARGWTRAGVRARDDDDEEDDARGGVEGDGGEHDDDGRGDGEGEDARATVGVCDARGA